MKFSSADVEIYEVGSLALPPYKPVHYAVSPDMLDRLLAYGVKREHIHVIEEPYGPWAPIKESESRRRILEGID